jgi:type IV fimbrial biogenesis protein FimT
VLKPAAWAQQGVTLIELMITLTIIGIALALATPVYWEWLQNTQIRTAADSMLVGVKLARAEALKRNTSVLFQLMDSIGATCLPSATEANWVVSVTNASGKCDVADPEASPQIVRLKARAEGTSNVTVAASQSGIPQPSITFDALGRVTPTPAADITIALENPTGGNCVAASGKMRCLTVQVTAGGQARVCDPAAGTGDTRKC